MANNEQFPAILTPVRRGGIGPRDIAFVLFRRRWILLAVSLPIVIAGGGSLLARTGTYTAATRVLVELQSVDQPRWNTTGRSVDYDRELSTLLNIAMSVSVADRAAAALNDSLPEIRRIDPKLQMLQSGTEFRDYLAAGLEVNVVGESNILEFRQTAEQPRVALIGVSAMRTAFMQYLNNGRRNTGAAQYYSEQIETVRASIDSLLAVRGDVLGRNGYTSLEDDLRYSTGAAADAESKLREAQVTRAQLEKEYAVLLGYLERDPREFPAGQDESRASTLVGWRDMVGKHEDALISILAVHTEDSQPARQQRAMLEESLKRLREEEVAYTESVRLLLSSAREREATLAQQAATISSANRQLPSVYRQVSMIDTDIKSLRDLLDDLQGKWGEVRMNEMADERVSKVIALTEPEIVTVLAGGKTVVYFAMITMLAITLGIVAAFIQEGLDHRIYTPHDVEENLKLPVFASVSKAD
jgi:uncharacterized protein involved in exopolysaccharide biosynthesis